MMMMIGVVVGVVGVTVVVDVIDQDQDQLADLSSAFWSSSFSSLGLFLSERTSGVSPVIFCLCNSNMNHFWLQQEE